MRVSLALCVALGTSTAAHAWDDFERMTVATSLGNVLASEEYCGLSYDQAAISTFIDKSVPADDLEFNPMLSTMTDGASYDLEQMSESQKTAQCRQTERVARSNGFIE